MTGITEQPSAEDEQLDATRPPTELTSTLTSLALEPTLARRPPRARNLDWPDHPDDPEPAATVDIHDTDGHDHVIQELFALGLGLEEMISATDRPHDIHRLDSYVQSLDGAIRRIRTMAFDRAFRRGC